MRILGACHNSFFVFVSNHSRSGLAENWIQIRFLKICAVNKNKIDLFCLFFLLSGFLRKCGWAVTIGKRWQQ
jgi:hypothetical protein